MSADVRLRLRPSELFRRAIGEPDPWQVDFLDSTALRLAIATARQIGKSSCAAARAVHFGWRNPGTTSVVVAPSLEQASLLIDRARAIAGALPRRDQPVRDSKTRLGFPNGSQLVALPGDRPSSPRGWTVTGVLLLDESAWIKTGTWEAARPTVAPGAAIVMLSTPNGKSGFFYDVVAGGDSEWARVMVRAEESGRYTPGQLAELRRDLGDLRFSIEYGCVFATGAGSVFAPEWLAASRIEGSDGLDDAALRDLLASA